MQGRSIVSKGRWASRRVHGGLGRILKGCSTKGERASGGMNWELYISPYTYLPYILTYIHYIFYTIDTMYKVDN